MRIRIQFFVEDPAPGRERKHARGNRAGEGGKSKPHDPYPYPYPDSKRTSPGASDSLDRSRNLGDKAEE